MNGLMKGEVKKKTKKCMAEHEEDQKQNRSTHYENKSRPEKE